MANNNTSPDNLYLRSREDLLPYEDARMNSLLQGVANFYTTRNDQSTWGNFLRSLAIELAKLDYSYSYAIVNKDASFLTPPHNKRRWADPLYVSSNWPSKTQFDTEFKLMLVELISAYKLGSTVTSIQNVIFAYTGINIVVEELYKEIGNGVFDQSDRNSIKVSVSVGTNSLSQITTLTQLQQIVNSLYGAIDLAKPAHVGLEFTTVFGEGDDIDCFISPRFATAQQFLTMSDTQQALYALTSYVLISPAVFWIASTPTSNPFDLGTILRDSNGNLQLVIVGGKPGTLVPTWSQTSSGITIDNQITWKNISPKPTAINLTSNIVTVTVPNIFTVGAQVTLLNLALADSFLFLNGVKLSVLTSDGLSFTAAFTHVDVPTAPQSQGTLSFLPAAQINLLAFQTLSPTYQALYQANYTNTNCTSTGIEDTLRIFIRQVEQPPFDQMLIQAPVLDAKNPQTTVAGYGRHPQPTITAAAYALIPNITFNVVNTVSDGTNLGFTFNTLVAPGNLPLHEGERVTIAGTTNGPTLALSSVANAVGPSTVYTGVITGGGANAFAGQTFQITGFANGGNNGTIVCTASTTTTLTLTNAGGVAETLAAVATTLIFNITGKIRDVIMITPTSGLFQIPLPTPGSPVASAAQSGRGIVSPTIQSAYTLQAGQYILSQTVPPFGDPTTNVATDAVPAQLNPANKWIILTNVDNFGTIYVTGEVSNWDVNHQIGLLAPRLDQVWEIGGGDTDFVFGLT